MSKAHDVPHARWQFETLLSDLSAALIALAPAAVDSQVPYWLGRIVESFGLDRASIMRFARDSDRVFMRHHYARSGIPVPDITNVRELPWYTDQLLTGQRLLLLGLPERLPPEATAEREFCLRQGLRSNLSIPLKIGGTLIGALTFGSFDPAHEWPEELVQRLELFGRIFANALHRFETDQALRMSEARLQLALEAAAVGTWEWDVSSDKIVWSARALAIHGRGPDQTPRGYEGYVALAHPDDRPAIRQAVADCLEGRTTDYHLETRLIWPDGSLHWTEPRGKLLLDEAGRPLRMLGTVADITKRKQVEQALRESEAHFRAIFEEAPIGLAYVDSSFRLRKVNRFLCQFLGYTAEELCELTIADLTHPEDIDRDTELVARAFRGQLESYQLEKRYLRKTGETVWGLLTVTLLRDKDGEVPNVLGMVEDITDRKEVEGQLLQAQKMDALGQLAGGVAHDFNNLLTAINGYSEISLSQLPKDHALRANLEEILSAGDRAAALTRQLLAFSRKQVRHPEVIDLSSVVEDMQKMLRRLIGENIKLVTSVDAKGGWVLADPGQIEQILVNLAINARDAMPDGGKLMIELSNVYLDQEYARYHLEVKPGPYVLLAVSDTGCGMSRAVLQRIFEPFFTTKGPGRGTGLGLPTVYGIVKQSGGHIFVHSEEGVGSKFKIYLPSAHQPPEGGQIDRLEAEAPGGTETVLLVEDDDGVRNMILRVLRDKGYEVVVARDGAEALLLLERANREFHLLLTDVVMPKMSGRQLSDALRHRRPHMRVLYVSGYAQDAMVHHGVLDQGVLLLEKPFTRDELLRRVREALSQT